MLGEKVGDFRGRITGQRVLQSDGTVPKFETSAEVSGTIVGIEATVMATYWAVLRPDGHLYGECPDQGMVITKDGTPRRTRHQDWGGSPDRAPP